MKGHYSYWAKIEDIRTIMETGGGGESGGYKGRKDAIKE